MPDTDANSSPQRDGEALFVFDRVTVRGDRGDRLSDISTAIPAAGVTCLLGPSGAGKSTLLRLCNRLEVADEGEVRFHGRPLADEDPLTLRRRVGMVFQRPTVFTGTVADNLRVADPDADRAVMTAALDRADLEASFLEAETDALSGGEAQRVCLARALIAQPEVLLMDEPTSALDPTSRRALERLACRLAGDGVPVLWVTHDIAQTERIADHVVVLRDGRLAQTGAIEEIRANPAPGVAAFLEGRDGDQAEDGDGDESGEGQA